MRPLEVNGLARKNVHRFVVGGQGVMRKVGMKVECADAIKEAELIQIFIDGERDDLPRAFHERRSQSELIHNRNPQSLHHRTRILSEALLSGNERIPMMQI